MTDMEAKDERQLIWFIERMNHNPPLWLRDGGGDKPRWTSDPRQAKRFESSIAASREVLIWAGNLDEKIGATSHLFIEQTEQGVHIDEDGHCVHCYGVGCKICGAPQ